MPRFAPHGFIRQFVDLFRVNDGTVAIDTFTNPLAIVADRLVASVAMGNKTYALANAGVSADGYAHLAQLTRTIAGTSLDTAGVVTLTGLDNAGVTITDVIIPGTSTTVVQGVKAFKSVSTVVGSGWTINPDGTSLADTIVVGFAADLGLTRAAAADADIISVSDSTPGLTASFDGDADGTLSGTYFTPTGANGILDYTVVYRPVQSTVLTAGAQAATISATPALGFECEVEAFGFTADAALVDVGSTSTHTFTLATTRGTIATLVLLPCAAGATTQVIAPSIVAAQAPLRDADTLTITRVASGGVGFTSGSGKFYVRLRQRTQHAF